MEVVKKAAYTHLNRHIYLRLLEGFGLRENSLQVDGLLSPIKI